MARINRILAVLAVSTVLATCGGPSEPDGPPRPAALTVTGVRIEGPASVAPGASASYHLIATRTDGTTVDVTSQSTWHSSNTSVLSIESPGTVRGKGRGEASLWAHNINLQPSQFQNKYVDVFVLEDGTFRVKGRVQESGTGLPGARVEVVSGTGTGLIATTGSGGSYALYGLAGEVRIDATLDGFDSDSRTITVTDNMTVDIGMRPTTTPTDFTGTWTMVLTASAGCVPRFPEDASSRSYSATVSQTGTGLKLDVTGPQVASSRMTGIVIDRSLTLFLPNYDYYGTRYYSLVEQLTSVRFLAIAGTAHGEQHGNSVTGTLSGEFAIYGSGSGTGVRGREVSCERDDHGFRLDRN